MKSFKSNILSVTLVCIFLIIILSSCLNNEYTELHLSPEVCKFVFLSEKPITPTEFCKKEGAGTFLEGKKFEASVDEDGCLILKLNKQTVVEWKKQFFDLQVLSAALNEDNTHDIPYAEFEDTFGVLDSLKKDDYIIANDFTELIATRNADRTLFLYLLPACVEMQAFDGKDCKETKVVFMVEDSAGEFVIMHRFPEDYVPGNEIIFPD